MHTTPDRQTVRSADTCTALLGIGSIGHSAPFTVLDFSIDLTGNTTDELALVSRATQFLRATVLAVKGYHCRLQRIDAAIFAINQSSSAAVAIGPQTTNGA